MNNSAEFIFLLGFLLGMIFSAGLFFAKTFLYKYNRKEYIDNYILMKMIQDDRERKKRRNKKD
jgi:hypothetical protein